MSDAMSDWREMMNGVGGERDERASRPVEEMSFEEAIAELERIVERLERGQVPLAESIAIYERGAALKKRCEALLREAEMRIEKIVLDAQGNPVDTEPLDPEAGA